MIRSLCVCMRTCVRVYHVVHWSVWGVGRDDNISNEIPINLKALKLLQVQSEQVHSANGSHLSVAFHDSEMCIFCCPCCHSVGLISVMW
jgi:hypothetical protein